ncbi:sensor histidine kinase [Rubripirellula reticaptiva]|uniref:histidine kinase n=1 Tax=Rubripirellula reticaptiva TaxID=2528013 RepID=A0A5C6F5K9_9BACT|nr:HAMP domain-containing sensor histidine kinase [Rubripirellula reticaptiva]TWU55707.1 Sensor histidine kinase YycG [Rubripirellula reticaptiva]
MKTSHPTPSHLTTHRAFRRPIGSVAGPSSTASALTNVSATDAAARVISETAHDLRSPLTSVRESIQLIHNGDLGSINEDQRSYLSAAIDQCNCIDQMVGEMVQLERLRTGAPRALRGWTPVANIRRQVDDAIRSWAVPRGIDVLWDSADNDDAAIFADEAMMRRLVVNLATNAIRASREGSSVLIRLMRTESDEMIQWSVIDQGSGISERDIYRIADRQVSFDGGEGLGLSICRQLSAVHFSSLHIRSRLGEGTEVSFSTPAMGPRSVAGAWSRWRVAARVAERGPLQKPGHRRLPQTSATARTLAATEKRVRLDPPSIAIEITSETAKPRCEDRIAAGVVTLGAAVSRENADAFDRLLQTQMQLFELAYRTDTRRWVWVFDVDAHGVDNRIAMINDAATNQIGGVRMAWTPPQMIPVDERRTESRLSDLMVRESLAASKSSTVTDHNEVRLGSSPLVHSDAAAARLDAELRRLSNQMRGQTSRLRQQARNLRPLN